MNYSQQEQEMQRALAIARIMQGIQIAALVAIAIALWVKR